MTTNLNTGYTPIDQATWTRREYFYYFTKLMPTSFSVTINLDITKTLTWSRAHQVKFNAVYLYLVSHLLTSYPEMRVGRLDEQLVTFDVLHPTYTILHADHTMASLWTPYTDDFQAFYQAYLADLKTYQDQPGPMPKAPQSANLVTIGSLPLLNFSSYTPLPATPLNTFFPIFQAGKFVTSDSQTTMPLSLTINHATADGYHVSTFLNELQVDFDQPQRLLNR